MIREVSKHPCVESIVQCEIDKVTIYMCVLLCTHFTFTCNIETVLFWLNDPCFFM